jgi:hypothetical protein
MNMIRVILGFFLVFGSVGGMENAGNDVSLIPLMVVAMVGLALMYFGVEKINGRN